MGSTFQGGHDFHLLEYCTAKASRGFHKTNTLKWEAVKEIVRVKIFRNETPDYPNPAKCNLGSIIQKEQAQGSTRKAIYLLYGTQRGEINYRAQQKVLPVSQFYQMVDVDK